MKEIVLKHGYICLVDDDDYERVMKYKWYPLRSKINKTSYVTRHDKTSSTDKKIAIHQFIMGSKQGDMVDHIDMNGLNNQKSNLRFCDKRGNIRNTPKRRDNKSGYKGVSWDNVNKKWTVRIRTEKHYLFGGYFNCLIKAAKKYDILALEHHKEFAHTNFPKDTYLEKQI